ncbi:MAG: hypothetical protein ABJG75_18330, partial [Roseobacter sp.]
SPINDYSLSGEAFRANIGMLAAEFVTSTAQLSHRTDLENDVQIPPIGTRTRKPSSPWINHTSVCSVLSP